MKAVFILLLLFPLRAICQTGPGGVGTTDGASALRFWFDANDLNADGDFTNNPSDGSGVTTWSDKSGNGLNAVSTGSNTPTYLATATNGFPGVDFSTNDDRLNISGMPIGANASFYLVFEHRNQSTGGSNLRSLFTESGAAGDWSLHSTSGTSTTMVFKYPHSSNLETLPSFAKDNNPHLLALYGTSGTGQDYIDNNTQAGTTAFNKTSGFATEYFIGSDPSGGSREYSGYITEIIGFSAENNAAQKIIIANYLSAKYGFSLGTGGLYTQDDNGFDYEVAGIGRVDASNLHNDAQGTGIVRIFNPGNLGDNEFLIWGHNNGALAGTVTTGLPAPVEARFARVWRVNEASSTGVSADVGSIDIQFKLANLGPITASDLRLLVDTNNDGLFSDETPIAGAFSVGGNVYQFTGVTEISNNVRFTIGTINTAQTPLPVELVDFNARVTAPKRVCLEWSTASEINNDYFTIERSGDAAHWKELTRVDGAGNSNSQLKYTVYDENPLTGISYYRLKQTDFDGKVSYAPIKNVNVDRSGNFTVEVYPNPTKDQVTLLGDEAELQHIAVYNVLGENVTHLAPQSSDGATQTVVDLSALGAGLYYLKTPSTVQKVYKQ